jgi:hypothetical protein
MPKCKFLTKSGIAFGKYEMVDVNGIMKKKRKKYEQRTKAYCKCDAKGIDDCPKVGTRREGSVYNFRGEFRPRVTPICSIVYKLEKLRV